MKQIQILDIYFDKQTKTYNPVYCPITGELLISSDPYQELDTFPDSVFAVYSIGLYDCEPIHIKSTVREDFFSEVGSLEDMIEKLKNLNNQAFIILNVMHYGIIPGDAGGLTYILEVPDPLIRD